MTILVQDINSLSSCTRLELVCLSRDTHAWWDMETIPDIPVDLDLGILNPKPLDVVFCCLDILALSLDHFRPATVNRGWLAVGVKRWKGEDAKVIAQYLCDARHGP